MVQHKYYMIMLEKKSKLNNVRKNFASASILIMVRPLMNTSMHSSKLPKNATKKYYLIAMQASSASLRRSMIRTAIFTNFSRTTIKIFVSAASTIHVLKSQISLHRNVTVIMGIQFKGRTKFK